jgi:hypothetical protein
MRLGSEVTSARKREESRDALFRGRGANAQFGALRSSIMSEQLAIATTTHSKRLFCCRDLSFVIRAVTGAMKGYPRLGSSAATDARSRFSTLLGRWTLVGGKPQPGRELRVVRPQDRNMAPVGQDCTVHPPSSRLPAL